VSIGGRDISEEEDGFEEKGGSLSVRSLIRERIKTLIDKLFRGFPIALRRKNDNAVKGGLHRADN